MVIIGIILVGFTFVYLRDQFCLAVFLVVILVLMVLLTVEYIKLKKWLKGTVNIQITIHKKEDEEDKNK